MQDQTFLHELICELKFVFNAVLSPYLCRRGKIEEARRRLDAAFSMKDQPPPYLLAYDACLMIGENRHHEARSRFQECLTALPEDMDLAETYTSLCCRFWLSAYNENCSYSELEDLRERMASLNVGRPQKHFLTVPSKPQLLELLGSRNTQKLLENGKSKSIKRVRVHYGSDFNAC